VAKWRGRKGRPWERLRLQILEAYAYTCHICGHGGAGDVDHVVPRSELLRRGLDPADPSNLKPAHGTRSPCRVCGRVCNQSKGARAYVPRGRASRDW